MGTLLQYPSPSELRLGTNFIIDPGRRARIGNRRHPAGGTGGSLTAGILQVEQADHSPPASCRWNRRITHRRHPAGGTGASLTAGILQVEQAHHSPPASCRWNRRLSFWACPGCCPTADGASAKATTQVCCQGWRALRRNTLHRTCTAHRHTLRSVHATAIMHFCYQGWWAMRRNTLHHIRTQGTHCWHISTGKPPHKHSYTQTPKRTPPQARSPRHTPTSLPLAGPTVHRAMLAAQLSACPIAPASARCPLFPNKPGACRHPLWSLQPSPRVVAQAAACTCPPHTHSPSPSYTRPRHSHT